MAAICEGRHRERNELTRPVGDTLAQESREGERGLGRIVRGDLILIVESLSKGR